MMWMLIGGVMYHMGMYGLIAMVWVLVIGYMLDPRRGG